MLKRLTVLDLNINWVTLRNAFYLFNERYRERVNSMTSRNQPQQATIFLSSREMINVLSKNSQPQSCVFQLLCMTRLAEILD